MNDPHVERLVYSLTTDDTLDFDDPDPVELETGSFRLRLEAGELTVEMLEHHAEPASAREVVEPHLKAWSLLSQGGRMSFEFEGAEVVDRDPPEGNVQHLKDTVSVTDSVSGKVTANSYLAPPEEFEPSPAVERMLAVYEDYLEGRRPIGSMGYYCLTELGNRLGGRTTWRNRLDISNNVATTLSRLTGGVGDHQTGRKVGGGVDHRPHTPSETQWIKRTVALLIRRLGEWEHDPDRDWPKLTMGDLPDLPS